MGVWTDIDKRIVYITLPNKWTSRRKKGDDEKILEGVPYSPRTTLKFIRDLNGKKKILGKRKRGQHHAKYWSFKVLPNGTVWFPIRAGKSKWGMQSAKRIRKLSKYQGIHNSNRGIDRMWLYSKKVTK